MEACESYLFIYSYRRGPYYTFSNKKAFTSKLLETFRMNQKPLTFNAIYMNN
jgi:hypothetical protein